MNRTQEWQEWLPQLAEAGLANDSQRLEVVLLDIIRRIKRTSPEIGKRLAEMLAANSANPGSLRWKEAGPPPVNDDQGVSLLKIQHPIDAPRPIFSAEVGNKVEQFIRDRQAAVKLVQEGLTPPSTLLLTGKPGTGKTMLAQWMARQLELPLVVQDLATSISSYLGKTGYNLRRMLDYARNRPTVLLLDEFDSIAKRRDDNTEVGELKRIVNVLLKELEDWPIHSVLIAATNHPELLDPAIGRRFHEHLHLPLPSIDEREEILKRAAGHFAETISPQLLRSIASVLDGWSGSHLTTMKKSAIRRHVVDQCDINQAVITEVVERSNVDGDHLDLGQLVRGFQNARGKKATVRELAALFRKSTSTIQHHLKAK